MANGLLDPRSIGMLSAAGGLLQASGPSRFPISTSQAFGQAIHSGIQGYGLGLQNQRTEQLIDLERRKAEVAEQQLKRAQQQYELQQRLLGQFGLLGPNAGAPSSTSPYQDGLLAQTPPGMSADTSMRAFGTPQFATDNPQLGLGTPQSSTQLGRSDAFPFTPTQLAGLQLAGMPDLTGAYNASLPSIRVQDGFLVDAKRGVIGTLPQTNQQGFSTMNVPDGRGGWQTIVTPGSLDAFTQQQRASERAKAERDPFLGALDVQGRPIPMTRETFAQQYGGGQTETHSRPGIPAPGAGMGPTAAESKAAEVVAGEMAKQYSDLLRADFAAPAKIANYERLGNLLSQVNTGKYRGTITDFKAAAKSFGFDLSAMGVSDDVAPAQAARALSNTLALELRNPAGGAGMPGALSDKDREFLIQSIPGLENDPAAIPLMIEFRLKIAKREQQVAKMARDYKKRTGRFDEGFYGELAAWSERNPLFTDADRRRPAPIPKNPANRNLGIQFMGFEPQ